MNTDRAYRASNILHEMNRCTKMEEVYERIIADLIKHPAKTWNLFHEIFDTALGYEDIYILEAMVTATKLQYKTLEKRLEEL